MVDYKITKGLVSIARLMISSDGVHITSTFKVEPYRTLPLIIYALER